jgi:hypothetical protein
MKTLTTISMTLAMLAGVAMAGDPKAGAPAPPADKAPAAAEMPKPPAELGEVAKMMAGTWKCTGQAFMDMKDPTKGTDMKATITHKLDLNNWWIQSSFSGSGKFPLKFTSFTTYDAGTKKWYRFGADNMGGARTVSSSGMKDNKMVWEGDARSPMGTAKIRETEEMTKDGMHVSGEMSMDGKTWGKTHDAICKK